MALDEDRFQSLIAHIDKYIGQRLANNNEVIVKETNDKLTIIIVSTIKDALAHYSYQLTANDINVIAERIQKQTETEFTERDLNEILLAILGSEKFFAVIDSRVKPAFDRLDQHDADIEGIKLEVAKLKLEVIERFNNFGDDVSELRGQQKNLGDDFYRFKLENDEKLQQLMLEVDGKLASLGDSHFTSVDASVKKNLLTILGFDFNSVDGEMNEDSIKNWISSMFVAKRDLEERLKLVEANGNKAFKLQLDENAGILMSEINEEIKKQITIAVAAKANELKGDNLKISGGLSEGDVLKIVKDVLAVYDADKTGLVDFALETAGGQVLSTR